MKMKKGERNKTQGEKPNSANTIAHHSLTNAPPIPEQKLATSGHVPPFIDWAWHPMVWNIPLSVWVSCPGHAPPGFWCTCSWQSTSH